MSLKKDRLIRSFCRRFKRHITSPETNDCSNVIKFSRSLHGVSRKDISSAALKVLYRLKEGSFSAYLVGGSVRDLLLDRKPKDFDVVTDAKPEQIRQIFRNSRIIGRRFRLVHIYFKDEIIEVSTFRANIEESHFDEERIRDGDLPLLIRTDNVYGTIEEDAWRRDFTINALFYGIDDFSVVDYTGGMTDLKAGQIRMIGDPSQRFHEDPVRLLRAIRLAAKLDFQIEPKTKKQVFELGHLLNHVPKARLLDEITKFFFEGHAFLSYSVLKEMSYTQVLFPALDKILKEGSAAKENKFINVALKKTDERYYANRRLTPGFLLSALLWPVVALTSNQHLKKKASFFTAIHKAMHDAIESQAQVCLITKRMKDMMYAVWFLQYHLEKRKPRRIMHLLQHRYFRAAFDLLELRFLAGSVTKEIYSWWEEIQAGSQNEQMRMVERLK